MKWFDNWVLRRAEQILVLRRENDRDIKVAEKYTNRIGIGNAPDRSSPNGRETLNFKVYNAVGGKIVEFSRYDERRDRHDHDLYIINNDQDFGERIAKIATLEVLK